MQKLGKKPLFTFTATFNPNLHLPYKHNGSYFHIEGNNCLIPSSILRRNFPQAKTNTRLKIQFYPWEIDIGRTIWLKLNYGNLFYTFSRKGKVITSSIPYPLQKFLVNNLGIKDGNKIKLKISVTTI